MPSSSERLQVWGISTETVDTYSLDGSDKKLIHWVLVDCIHMHMALDENSTILFSQCSMHWCWKRLHAWDTVVSYSAPRYVLSFPFVLLSRLTSFAGERGSLGAWKLCVRSASSCLSTLCVSLVRSLQTKWHPFSELQYLVTGLPWTEDYPSTTSQEQ